MKEQKRHNHSGIDSWQQLDLFDVFPEEFPSTEDNGGWNASMNAKSRHRSTNVKPGRDLESLFPDVAKRWHPTANAPLMPSDVPAHSNKKYYWVCDKGHTYDAVVHDQVAGQGCPYCANRRLLVGFNDLKTRCPDAAEDWDYELNKDNPEDHKYCSQDLAYWKCKECGYRWERPIKDRAKAKYGCPICTKKKRGAAKSKTIAKRTGGIQDPQLLKEWDYERNEKAPSEYPPQSSAKVWWVCPKCGHHYLSKINNRYHGRGCPCCRGLVVVPGINDLATTHPDIAKEWHPTKNLPLTPEQVSYGQAKKVWWVCPEGHEYQATLLHRASGGTNCPICNSGRQTSFAEQAVYFYVKKVFPDAINRYTEIFEKGMELDIYIPSQKLGIEYDGEAWHGDDKIAREIKKCEICHKHGIKLIRLKENIVNQPNSQKYWHTADRLLGIDGNMYEPAQLSKVIRMLLDDIDPVSNPWFRKNPLQIHSPVDINIARDAAEIRSYMTKMKKGSFAELYPDLAREWHPVLNGSLTPDKVKPHSDIKVWWICPDCGKEYPATVGHRVSGTGCRDCGFKKSAMKRAKKVEMLDIETGEVLRVFDSVSDASRQMHISSGNICAVIKGQRRQASGYIWKYVE